MKKQRINILKWAGFFVALAAVAAAFVFILYAKDLPRPEKFTEKQFFQSTKIYDKTGDVLFENLTLSILMDS